MQLALRVLESSGEDEEKEDAPLFEEEEIHGYEAVYSELVYADKFIIDPVQGLSVNLIFIILLEFFIFFLSDLTCDCLNHFIMVLFLFSFFLIIYLYFILGGKIIEKNYLKWIVMRTKPQGRILPIKFDQNGML